MSLMAVSKINKAVEQQPSTRLLRITLQAAEAAVCRFTLVVRWKPLKVSKMMEGEHELVV